MSISNERALLITQVLSADGKLLASCEPATHDRVDKNLVDHGKSTSLSDPFTHLKNPLHAFAAIVLVMGEAYIDANLPKFKNWIFEQEPLSPDFLRGIVTTSYRPLAFDYLLKNAKSSQFSQANTFASAAASIDDEIGDKLTDEEGFKLISAIANAAYWGAYEAISLRDGKFEKTPKIKKKAVDFSAQSPTEAQAVLDVLELGESLADLQSKYF